MLRRCIASLLLVSSLVMPVAARAAGSSWRPDGWVTTKIKILLMTAGEVSAFNVNVDTVDGRVTLHGKVPTGQEKTDAESLAREVAGVVDVQNLLQVVPNEQIITTAVRDDALRRLVSDALQSDPKLEDSAIKVKSVNQGVVLLSGKADSLMEHLEAIRVASSVDGVRRVATEVRTGDLLYDARLWQDAESAVVKRVTSGDVEPGIGEKGPAADSQEEPPEVITDAADGGGPGLTEPARLSDVMADASVTAAIKARLLEDPNVPALSINVDTNEGVVTLFGQARDEQARKKAEAHARHVPGVIDVRNEIQVVQAGGRATRVEDDSLKEKVESALEKREHLEHCKIVVSAKDGVIGLDGSVPNRELKDSAATIARAVPGVRSVHNRLRVAKD